MNVPTKETMAKYLQLMYWNKYLYEHKVITQQDYLRMVQKIQLRYPVISKKGVV